jgi:hypothetical protein
MKKIFLDLDGVLCDFDKGHTELYQLDYLPGERREWTGPLSAFKRKTGKGIEDFWLGMSVDFWFTLDKTKECDQILALVEPFDAIIITAPPIGHIDSTANAVKGKTKWIRKNLPKYFFEGRFLIGSAKEFCASDDAILIDDNQDNCIKWEQAGGKSILVPREWNAYRDMPVVENIQAQLMELMGDEY